MKEKGGYVTMLMRVIDNLILSLFNSLRNGPQNVIYN